MTLTVNLRPLLHPKRWEGRTPAPVANAAGSFIVAADMGTQMSRIFMMTAAASVYVYYGAEDAWLQLPASGLAGTYAAGACGCFHPDGPSGTATGGSTTTINTNLTIVRDLRGHKVRFTAGPNAGVEATIKSNTIGANSVITLVSALGTAVTAASVFTLRTGRFWAFIPSASAPGFGYYDWATNAWTARAVTGLPASFTLEGQLVTTDGQRSGVLLSGTASAGAASTLTDGTKTWVANALANLQVRITGGTGAGQVRNIASNTGSVITTSTAWTTNPDATSTYVVEGNDDVIFLFGNSAVTLYKYSISGNTWTTVAPAVARGGAHAAGGTADLIVGVQDADWTNVNQPLNGRYIYCFRGGATNILDRYDIAANSWSVIAYGNQFETFTTGSSSTSVRERIYINKDSANRLFYFDVVINALRPFTTFLYGMSTATVGNKVAILDYTDGAAELNFVYLWRSTGADFFRIMEIK